MNTETTAIEALQQQVNESLRLQQQRPSSPGRKRRTPKLEGAPLLTTAELCRRLQISRRTIGRLCLRGLPFVPINSVKRFDWRKVQAWLRVYGSRRVSRRRLPAQPAGRGSKLWSQRNESMGRMGNGTGGTTKLKP